MSLPEAGGRERMGCLSHFHPRDWEDMAALWLTVEGRAGSLRRPSDASSATIPAFLSNIPNFISRLHTSPMQLCVLGGTDSSMGSRVGIKDYDHSKQVTPSRWEYDSSGPRRILL